MVARKNCDPAPIIKNQIDSCAVTLDEAACLSDIIGQRLTCLTPQRLTSCILTHIQIILTT
jgi:hypothetical protein